MTTAASSSFPALGTTATVCVTEATALSAARGILEQELAAIDLACSRFRSDSELSRANAAGGRPVAASGLFLEAVEVALAAARITEGAVDPTVGRALRAIGYDRDFESMRRDAPRSVTFASVPGWKSVTVDQKARTVRVAPGVELDLGATAKALAADRAAARIERAVSGGALVNLGGDIAVAGCAPHGGWRIRVTDDHQSTDDSSGQTVSVAQGGLATSSTTLRRWTAGGEPRHHIIDPRTGMSAESPFRTASVAARSCVDANTASTAAIVWGRRVTAWLWKLGLPSRLVAVSGELVRVAGWPREARA